MIHSLRGLTWIPVDAEACALIQAHTRESSLHVQVPWTRLDCSFMDGRKHAVCHSSAEGMCGKRASLAHLHPTPGWPHIQIATL